MPSNKLDGVDISSILLGDTTTEPHESLAFYSGTELHAVRAGKWKLHFSHKYLTPREDLRSDGKPAGYGKLEPKSITESGVEGIASRHGYRVAQLPMSLFDLSQDVGEQHNVLAENPAVVARLQAHAELYRQELGDSLTGITGSGVREIGRNDR